MAGDYPITQIGEVAASISDTHKFGKEQLVFLNTSDILHGKFLHRTYSAVKDWPGQAKKSIRKDDILFSEIRPANGRWAYVDQDADDFVVSTKLMVIRAKQDRLFPKFLYQFLTSSEITKWLQHLAESRSGTFPQITFDQVATLELPLPPLAEQKAIAAVLGALDDKIELNRRMNATLEAMARALFQSWFVDFDPVRAKLDGRPAAALDPATAALFPEHLEDSPLGHIPKGWKAGTVIEGFNLTMGQSPPGDTYNEEGNGVPFYQGRTDFGFRFPTRRIYCSAPTRYAKPGDTLVSVRAPVGDINMANEECCIGRGVAAVRHKSGATSFTYHSMANLYPDFARFEAEGTVFGSINKDSFEKLRFVIPPDEIVAAYERQAGPLDEQIRILENQSRTLATLRDTLLPRLLSGELSVPATDKESLSVQNPSKGG
jgi:type I restriction enzyme S subunit